jgi:hypothetical protein
MAHVASLLLWLLETRKAPRRARNTRLGVGAGQERNAGRSGVSAPHNLGQVACSDYGVKSPSSATHPRRLKAIAPMAVLRSGGHPFFR